MADPYLGEIRMFAGNFAPAGWLFCAGQILPISEYDALFNLVGTTYGGDGESTFGLPDLQGRVPLHAGQGPGLAGYVQGEKAGVESVTLSAQQQPAHQHAFTASTAGGTSNNPQNNVVASAPSVRAFIADAPSQVLPASSITPVGGSQPHENRMQTLTVNYIISLFGEFPHQ